MSGAVPGAVNTTEKKTDKSFCFPELPFQGGEAESEQDK